MRSLSSGSVRIATYRLIAWGASGSIPAGRLKEMVSQIASKAGGFEVAVDVLQMRLHSDRKAKQEDAPELLDAGRELIRQVPFVRTPDTMLDYRLGEIGKSCLGGQEGRAVVVEVCRRLKRAVAKYEARASSYDDLIGGLFEAQPAAALDALCGGGPLELAGGLRMIGGLRQNPLDSMPESELFAWCNQEPSIRYPEVAGAITVWHGAKEGEAPQWTSRALHLLDRARDRIAVLRPYVGRIGLRTLDGANPDPIIILLDALTTHTEPAVAQYAAQESARLGQIVNDLRRAQKEAEREKDESFE
jgi:hypothetical protein